MPSSWKDDLSPFFERGRLAVVGATDRFSWGRFALTTLQQLGYPPEQLVLVNPRREEIMGYPCLADLDAVEGRIDSALILLNRDGVAGSLRQAAAKGARSAVVIASGYAEQDARGAELQAELRSLAEELGVLVCGPNCTGLADVGSGASGYAGAGRLPTLAGGVSIVAQSGAVLNQLLEALGARRIGLRRVVSAGNAAVVGPEDFLHYLARDPGTRVIVTYLEGVRDAARLREALELAREATKPVLALWAARSERSQRAVSTHTGSVVTSSRAWVEVLRQKGALLHDDLASLTESVALFARAEGPVDRRLAFLSVSGGDAALCVDVAAKHGLELVEMSRETTRTLAEALGRERITANPLDLQGGIDFDTPASFDERWRRWFDPYLEEPFSVLVLRPHMWQDPGGGRGEALAEMNRLVRGAGKQLVVVEPFQFLEPDLPGPFLNVWRNTWQGAFERLGIPCLHDLDRGLAAIARLAEHCEHGPKAEGDVVPAAELPLPGPRDAVWVYSEAAATASAIGIPLVETAVAHSSREAVEVSRRLDGPSVLKADSRLVPHRAALGVIALDLCGERAVSEAFARIEANLAGVAGNALMRVLVQPQLRGRAELLLGTVRDPVHGDLVVVGEGGGEVGDRSRLAMAACPLRPGEAAAAVGRALPGLHANAASELTRLVLALAAAAPALGSAGLELEVNPLLVLGDGSLVGVDVLVAPAGRGV